MYLARFLTCLSALLILLPMGAHSAGRPELEQLGEKLYFDSRLSEPAGQSCASCHQPAAGFADPDRELPVSRGVHPQRFSNRNAPTAAYALFSPPLYFDEQEQHYVGGQFWDGHAKTLEEQARLPFTNPVEMANSDPAMVVDKVRRYGYQDAFDALFGKGSLDNTEQAFEHIVAAIAAFERTEIFRPFTSKFDYYLAGKVQLTDQEKRGLELFNAEDKGNCAACHPTEPPSSGNPPLLTDFTYDNLGVPRNPDSPFFSQSTTFNPEGPDAVDIGLGKTTGRKEDNGKFKVSTLRNIELTPPYMHNGVFKTLRETVEFYNSRDVDERWGEPEVAENVNREELGNLGLSDDEIDDIVSFMLTLTDGYQPATQ